MKLDLSKAKYFGLSERLVQTLVNKTQNDNPLFFRILVAFYFAELASMMRTNIVTHDRGVIPVNIYAINLSASGTGKTFSSNIIEESVINKFKENFLNTTFEYISHSNLDKLAHIKAAKANVDVNTALEQLQTDFHSLGPLVFNFDSGTSPAVKQMRQKLLMANCGSINLVVDEIGSNLVSNTEVLNTFLDLYDIGKTKQKLTKNTSDNRRIEEIDGRTPTNMMLYGTPSKLLDGSKTEDEFYSMLETGYARRCLFGYARKVNKLNKNSAEDIYNALTNKSSDSFLLNLSTKLGNLADPSNFNSDITMSKDIAIMIIEYRLLCENVADTLKDHQEILKAEISHRYYKALKLAGAYAFIDGSNIITEDILLAAIKLVEESGNAFASILNRERPYVKLAKYIADMGKEITQVELLEDLPFYKGSEAVRRDMMNMAIAYGYKNNIIIKRSVSDNIEFFLGESMEETKISNMKVSYSQDITTGFIHEEVPWEDLYKLVTAEGYHYAAHAYRDGYRSSEKAIQGFNLVMVDVDGGISFDTAKLLLKGHKALFATTKRHTDQSNRFRVIFPLSHIVKLNPPLYRKFMQNVFDWLPFDTDSQTTDIARKWETYPGTYEYQDGDMLDALLFIPDTKKQEEQTKKVLDHNSLSNLERWFLFRMDSGNRNNNLIKLALAMVDSNMSVEQIRQSIHNFNSKIKNPLPEDEINNTIMLSVMRAVTKRDMLND